MKLTAIFLLLLCVTVQIQAADDVRDALNPVRTSLPFLTITPDARSGGMGDVGAATDPDIFSQHWNPAKYAFAYSKAGIGLAYTPWLSKLVNDINLGYLAGFYKMNDNVALASSLRYFSLGNIDITAEGSPQVINSVNPYELAWDVSAALKLTETFALSVAGRFIYSDLGSGAGLEGMYPASTVAVDLSGFYSNYIDLGNSECLLGLGFNASNIGPKISYDGGNNFQFLPTNLRVGVSLLYPLDEYNTLSFNADLNKYIVPTPPNLDRYETQDEKDAASDRYNNMSFAKGLWSSFSDGSAKEELQEIAWALGAEYAYDNKFFVRGGYFHESPVKGNRQYFSLGTGFKLTAFQLDVAYLISTVPSNPLDQTLRFSLSFDMDGLKNLIK